MDGSCRLGTTTPRLNSASLIDVTASRRAWCSGACSSSSRLVRSPVQWGSSRSTTRCEAGNGQHADEPQHSQQLPTYTPHVNGKHRDRHDALPLSLYNPYTNLPCDGKTRTEEEEACDPYSRNCQTPMHVWETNCKKCNGTGTVASYARGGRGGRGTAKRLLYTCPSCHGVGCVRHTSSRIMPDVNGGNGQYTAGRPPCQITWEDDGGKKKSLFDRFKEKLGG